MSVAQLIASLGGYQNAEFIGRRSINQGSTQINLPNGSQGDDRDQARVGDLMALTYYNARTIGSGSGTPFNFNTFSETRVAFRLIEAGDIGQPITFNSDTPCALMVWRGPTSLSASRSSLSGSGGSSPFPIPGFTPSANAMGIVGCGWQSDGTPNFNTPPFGIWENAAGGASTGYGYAMGSLVNLDAYSGGDLNVSMSTPGSPPGPPGSYVLHAYELLA